MRNDSANKMGNGAHFKLDGLIAPIGPQRTAPEVVEHELEHLLAVIVLAYREAGSHVPPGAHRCAPAEGHIEATLTVYVTRDVRRKIHGPHRRIGYRKNCN